MNSSLPEGAAPSLTPGETFASRKARLDDALAMRQPDRVPVLARFGGLLATLEGVASQELYADPARMQLALENAMLRFQPDSGSGMWHAPGPSVALGDRSTRWPGHGGDANAGFQYLESEYMKAEDYGAFLADASDFAVRKFLPRVFERLEGLAALPPLPFALFGYYAAFQFAQVFALPEVAGAFEAMIRAGREQAAWIAAMAESGRRLAELGFPGLDIMRGSLLAAPFDFMADTLRGMKGVFLDMRRRPDQLLAAEERTIGFQLETARLIGHARACPYAFIPLHRGSDGFISIPAFERFYWPQLKSLMLQLIEAGITPVVFYEGQWEQRLGYLAELPAGKTIGIFQATDIFRVKEVLGGVMCIMGGMSVSALISSTPEEVRERTQEVCRRVGKGGGFIMTTDIGDLEGCAPELVKAWIDAVRECAP